LEKIQGKWAFRLLKKIREMRNWAVAKNWQMRNYLLFYANLPGRFMRNCFVVYDNTKFRKSATSYNCCQSDIYKLHRIRIFIVDRFDMQTANFITSLSRHKENGATNNSAYFKLKTTTQQQK